MYYMHKAIDLLAILAIHKNLVPNCGMWVPAVCSDHCGAGRYSAIRERGYLAGRCRADSVRDRGRAWDVVEQGQTVRLPMACPCFTTRRPAPPLPAPHSPVGEVSAYWQNRSLQRGLDRWRRE
jgi:hypothetical protein